MTYEGGDDLAKIQDPISRKAIEIQVNEYGQTPKQLFKNPHPKRFSNKICEIFIDETKKIINFNIKEEQDNNLDFKDNNEDDSRDKVKENIEILKEEGDTKYTEVLEIKEVNFNFDRVYTQLSKFHKK